MKRIIQIFTGTSPWGLMVLLLLLLSSGQPAEAKNATKSSPRFKHIPTQYIVALSDPSANSGDDAQFWGLWSQDPGPRGCLLKNYPQLKETGVAPAQWKFDSSDWWLEEHGALMEKPQLLPPGKYVVTGGQRMTTTLTVDPVDQNGKQHWELGRGAKLSEVTHQPCHAARYTPEAKNSTCSPSNVEKTSFPVKPGVAMPSVEGCHKQEYAVLLVVGIEEGKK